MKAPARIAAIFGHPAARSAGGRIAVPARAVPLAILVVAALAPASASAAAPTIDQAILTEPHQTSFMLNAGLNPQGSAISDCHFAYGIGASLGNSAPCAGTNEVQTLTVVARAGQFKLSFEGQTTGDIPFDAPPGLVQGELQALSTIGTGNVRVSTVLIPTEAVREYPITFTGSLGATDVPTITAEDGTEPLVIEPLVEGRLGVQPGTGGTALEIINANLGGTSGVRAQPSGLTPDTTYSYRLIATNGDGTTEGPIGTFHTLEEPAGGTCPNEAIRIEQHATSLPECRAWELVSPTDKNGGSIFAEGATFFASTSGDGLAYNSQSVFGDAVGSGSVGHTTYLARREAAGWATHSITPPSRPEVPQALLGRTATEVFSDDLSRALTWGYDLPGADDDVPQRMNFYVEDTASRAVHTVSAFHRPGETFCPKPLPEPPPPCYEPYAFNEFLNLPPVWGASADLSHVALVSNTQFLPAIPSKSNPGENEYPNGAPNVYTWDEGTLHLAGILPDGSVPPSGSTVVQEQFRGAMSANGSRQSFIASQGGPNQLFLRIDHNRTVWVSEPEGTDKSEPGGIHFEGMTPDGKNVFFVSDSPLLDEDEASGPDLYRWREGPDPEHDLTLISNDGSAVHDPPAEALLGMSDDGEVVYVSATSLMVWDHGTRRVVGGFGRGAADNRYGLGGYAPGTARVSPDGRWVAFFQGRSLALYDLHSDTLANVAGNAEVLPALTQGNKYDNVTSRPRYLSEHGEVFFWTEEGLLPEDRNGIADTYEYDGKTGELNLISSETGDEAAMFAEASPSGDDVFFVTRNRLAAPDSDQLVDVYDARVGGGYPDESQGHAAACSGEVCQGRAATPPANTAIASGAAGKGNVHPARCRAKARNSKGRCVKKQHRNKHRKAAHKRRASK